MTAVCVCGGGVCVWVFYFQFQLDNFLSSNLQRKEQERRRQITPEGEHLLHYTARKLLSDFAVFDVIAELYVT